jgi:hypothetical protein
VVPVLAMAALLKESQEININTKKARNTIFRVFCCLLSTFYFF